MSVDINISNYEEFLLSYIDGELNNEEKTALEAFLQQHPQQARELEIYKSAMLKPDAAEVFENKTSLYRSTVITLENYEPFLLSYIDGELNAAETTALEAFLQKHPHVAQELDTWLATRLPAGDTVSFEHKEMLYRHADTLTIDNYETYYLSYIDGELTPAEEQTLLQFLQQHPGLQPTLQLLQRAKLQADTGMHMPGKAALYRHTATRARLRPVWWGAAAAVVAGAFLLWLLPLHRHVPAAAPIAAVQQPAPTPSQPENLQQPAPAHTTTTEAAQPPVMPAESPVPANHTPVREKHPLIAKNNAPVKRTVTQQLPVTASAPARVSAGAGSTVANNSTPPALAQLPQPKATSAEVVQQHLEKQEQQAIAIQPAQRNAAATAGSQVLASTAQLPHTPAPEAEPSAVAPAPEIQGELIMSVTSTNESKLLNGVTNVAKFFSRKKHQK